MTADQMEQAKIGETWHAVADRSNGVITCRCGGTSSVGARDTDISPVGETPEGLSGTNICYECVRAGGRP